MIIALSGKMHSGKNTVADIIQLMTSARIAQKRSGEERLNTPEGEDLFIKEASTYYNEPVIMRQARGIEGAWKQKSFAQKVKDVCSLITGIPVDKFDDQDFKNQPMDKGWEKWRLAYSEGIPASKDFATEEEAMTFLNSSHIRKAGRHSLTFILPTVREFMQLVGTNAMRSIVHAQVWVNALFADYRPLDDTKRASLGNVLDYSECPFPNWIITDTRFPNEVEAAEKKQALIIRIERPNMFKEPGHDHESEIALDNYPFTNVLKNDGTLEDLSRKVYLLLKENQIL